MKRNGNLQPVVLGAILATGFTVVWGVLALWAWEVGEYTLGDGPRMGNLGFLADGTPRVAYPSGPGGGREFRDLDGNVVPTEDDSVGFLAPVPLPVGLPVEPHAGEVPWGERIRSFADGRNPAVYWYFITDGRPDGTAYFAGYDSQSKVCVGYLGAEGFQDRLPPAAERIPFGGAPWGPGARVFCTQDNPWPTTHPANRVPGRAPRGSVSTWDVYVLGRDAKIYHADLQNRKVHVALEGPGIRSAALVSAPPDALRGTPHHLAARTDDAVLVLDERGGVLRRYPVPESLRGRAVTFAETTAGEGVMYAHSPEDSLATEIEYQICWVAQDGRVREAGLTLPAAPELRSMQVWGGAVVPSPLVLGGLVGTERTRELREEGLAESYPQALARALREYRPALVIAQSLAVVLAVLCYLRQVRYGAGGRERIVWPLFVLLLGLPGWVGYRYGRSWPVLESCPACRVRVPRDRPDCSRCLADFAPPALKGTEVFA